MLQPLPTSDTLALFRRLYEHSFDAVLLTSPRGSFLAANAQACAMFGASEEGLCLRSREGGHNTLADSSDPRLARLLAERAARGWARGEMRLRRVDGSLFEAEVSSVMFVDECGQAKSILTVRDISALRLAEIDARESREQLSFALEAADIGDWDMDLRSNIARRSLRHDRCFGYPDAVSEWGYDTFLAHVEAADRERVDACYRRAMAGEGEYDVEFRVRWPDGSLHWLWSRGRFYFDDSGTPYRVAGIQVDVTARHETTESLRRSEERLQLALRASNDALWDLDLQTGQAFYSPRWLQMLGYDSPGAAPGAAFWQTLCHPDDARRVAQTYQSALDGTASTYEMSFRMRHHDGHFVPLLSRGFVLRDAQGTAVRVSGTNTDLTERLRLEDAQRRQVAAEAASAAKTDFLSRMSHELRTPLNAVLGFSQLLLADQRQPLSSSQQRQAAQIERSGWHLLKLVDDILDLSQIDAGRVSLQLRDVDVAALLHECGGMVASAAAARQIGVEIQCDPALRCVRADHTRIRQILLNLLSNAVKYTQPGGAVLLDAVRGRGGRALLRVRDNGPGLSAQQVASLFQPFNRLGQEQGDTQGTGIGLVISRRLAALMGGDIQVDSTPGVGTVFTLSMAEGAQVPERGPTALREAVTTYPPPAPPRSVLYIEDNAVNVDVMRGMFKFRPALELEVRTCGLDALDAARLRKPDLILLDMQLPDIDGIEFLVRLRREPRLADVPVVVVSASAMPAQIAAASAVGAVDYLTKPVMLDKLLAVLDQHLAGAASNPA